MIVQLRTTNYYFNSILGNIIDPALAAPTLLAAAKVMLGTLFLTPSLRTTYADLTEANFVGYAQSATIVWGTPINDVDTTPTAFSPSHLFRMTATTTPNTIFNVAVTDGVASPSTGILASGAWTPGIVLENVGDGFTVVIGWNLGNVPGNLAATIIQ